MSSQTDFFPRQASKKAGGGLVVSITPPMKSFIPGVGKEEEEEEEDRSRGRKNGLAAGGVSGVGGGVIAVIAALKRP